MQVTCGTRCVVSHESPRLQDIADSYCGAGETVRLVALHGGTKTCLRVLKQFCVDLTSAEKLESRHLPVVASVSLT